MIIRRLAIHLKFTKNRNFFELNPIFPDHGQKDFDIYNKQKKTIPAIQMYSKLTKRQELLKKKVRDNFTLRKYNLISSKGYNNNIFDQQTGLPIGINNSYDEFIQSFKQDKKLGSNIRKQFNSVIRKIMKKFQVKSQFQLIRLFRINIAQRRKDSLKDTIRSKLIQQALIQTTNFHQKYSQIFFQRTTKQNEQNIIKQNRNKIQNKEQQQQINEISFKQALKQIDNKIKIEQNKLKINTIRNINKLKQYKQQFQQQKIYYNYQYNLNLNRQFKSYKIQHYKEQLQQNNFKQNYYIQQRIRRLLYLRKIQYIRNQKQNCQRNYDLPIKLKKYQKIMNELSNQYKQKQFLIEPNLQQIYQEIDYVLNKINIRMIIDRNNTNNNNKSNNKSNKNNNNSQQYKIHDRLQKKSDLLWKHLDVEEIVSHDYYSEETINNIKLNQKQIIHVSPSASAQLSLNRVPMNLYRHQQCEIFGVFTKYKHQIMSQVASNKSIDLKYQFNYFSLEDASNKSKQHRKKQNQGDKYKASAKRKKCQAQVLLTQGCGRVMINSKPIRDYFADTYYRTECLKPLVFTQTAGLYDVNFQVVGGGLHGQSQCCAFALTKALIKINPDFKDILSKFGLVGSDTRAKEPKKIGLYSARVRPPFARR